MAATSISSITASGVVNFIEEPRKSHHAIYIRTSKVRFVDGALSGLGKSVMCAISWRVIRYTQTGFVVLDKGPVRNQLSPSILPSMSPVTKRIYHKVLLYSRI